MKKLKYIMSGLLLVVCCLAISCKKLVDVPPPTGSLVTSSVFATDATAIPAQLSIYAKLIGQESSWEQWTALSSDELTYYFTNQFSIDLYHNSLNANDVSSSNGPWSGLYSDIYQENAILEGVQNSTGMSSRVKGLMTGEALFMRAYCYFQLVNFFGNVPLITSTDYTKNSTVPRTPKDLVYNQIVSDLQTAQTLLSSNYLDASDNTGATDRVRPTTWAADALLARVYLYTGKYNLAEQQASLVIANSTIYTLSPLTGANSVFKKNSTEAIWQLMPATGAYYVQGPTYILTAPPGGSSNTNLYTISQQLLNAFEANDSRRINWVSSFSQGSNTWYFPYKYQAGSSSTTLTEYSMVLRLAEQYLIRAEARVQQGNITGANGALADLNIIRNRAGLSIYSGPTDQASVLTVVLHEQQVELFCEEHRWFDLKRTNTVDAVMNVAAPQKSGSWNSYQQLYPVAVTDLQLNPNLVQNSGY